MKITFDISSLSPLKEFRDGRNFLILEFDKQIDCSEYLKFFVTLHSTGTGLNHGKPGTGRQISLLVNRKLKKDSAFQFEAREFGVSTNWLYTVVERCANEYERTAHLLLNSLPTK